MQPQADALSVLGRHTESDRLHQELIAKLESLHGADRALLSASLAKFGEHMLQSDRPDEAVGLLRVAVAVRQKAHADDGTTVVAVRQRLAEALYASSKVEDAVQEGRDVVAVLERAGGDPRPALGTARYALAKYLLGIGGMEEARRLLRQALSVFDETTGRGGREALQVIYLLAVTHTVTDELGEAERLVDEGSSGSRPRRSARRPSRAT